MSSQFPPPPPNPGEQPQYPAGAYSHQGPPPPPFPGHSPYQNSPMMPSSPAGLGKRLLAYLIDGIAIGGPISFLVGRIFPAEKAPVGASPLEALQSSQNGLTSFLPTLIFFVYLVAMVAVRGTTVGKTLMKIKIVNESGNPPGFGAALVRYVLIMVSLLACGVGALVLFFSPLFDNSGRRQGWHDKVAKTYEVNA